MARVRPVVDGPVGFDLTPTKNESRQVIGSRRSSAGPPMPAKRSSVSTLPGRDPSVRDATRRSSDSSVPISRSSFSSKSKPNLGGAPPDERKTSVDDSVALATARKEAKSGRLVLDPQGKIQKVKDAKAFETRINVLTTRYHGLACKLWAGHALGVYSVDFSPNGDWLCSSSHDGRVVVWDARGQTFERAMRGISCPVYTVSFSRDPAGSRIAAACEDGSLRVFFRETGDLRLELPTKVSVQCLAWSPSCRHIVTGNSDGSTILWNVAAADETLGLATSRMPAAKNPENLAPRDFISLAIGNPPMFPHGHTAAIRRVVWVNPNTYLSASDDGTARAFDSVTGVLMKELKGHKGPILDVAVNDNSSRVLTASQDATARVWSYATGSQMLVLKGHRGFIYSAAFTPEDHGRRIITGGHDRCMCVWDGYTGALLQRMANVHQSFVFSLSVRFDGLQFASASGDHSIGIWRALPFNRGDKCKACCYGSAGNRPAKSKDEIEETK